MSQRILAAVGLAVAVAITGCKFKKTDASDGDASGGTRASQVVEETFDSQFLPFIADAAQPIDSLRAAIAKDLDAAGDALGNRGAGQGAAWNFAVAGQGKVVEANLESRARKAELDTDGDGKADMTLQLGPVIRGTALRDVAPIYDFGDFRDQIEFAELARALNDRVTGSLVLPEGDIVGSTIVFKGAVPLKSAGDSWLVTAVSVEVVP